MRRSISIAMALALVATLAGCGGKEEEAGKAESLDKGQVVATVDGKDVTVYELNAELEGVPIRPGQDRKPIERAALQQVVNRKILADIARQRGLDKSPTFFLQQRRTEEALLVQMLQRQMASKTPPPTKDDARRYMDANPNLFAERKIFMLDQILFEPPKDAAQMKEFEPLKTLDQIEVKLGQDGLEFKRGESALDALSVPAAVVAKLLSLPPNEVFVTPGRGGFAASVIRQVKVQPFTDDRAVNYAMNLIRQQRLGETATRDLEPLVKKARDSVKYQPGYAPPPPKPAAKPAAAAPVAAPAAAPAPAAPAPTP